MSDERKIFLYFLTDSAGRSYYYDNGIVKKSITPKPLDKSPGGWLEAGVSFGRSSKFYGLNRTFTQPFKFVDDGAFILRWLMWQGKGIEETVTLVMLKWDDDTDIYKLYFKGEIDLTKIDDTCAESVTVNIMEGGIVSLLKSSETTTYEFPCDGTIPENKLVELDGIKFNDRFVYSTVSLTTNNSETDVVPIVFLYNDGYNVNVTRGDQSLETATSPMTYARDSANYFYKTYRATTFRIKGKFKITNTGSARQIALFIQSSKDRLFTLVNSTFQAGETLEFNIDQEIVSWQDEAFFLMLDQAPFTIGGFVNIVLAETQFEITFATISEKTTTWAIPAKDLWRLLVNKIGSGAYDAYSDLLDQYPGLFITSGDAIRKADKAVIKTSLSDFFGAINTVANASLGNQQLPGGREGLFIERKGYVFDSSVVTMNIGEVADLKLSVSTDHLFNTLKIGYAPQNYDEKAGRQEYNTTAMYKAPVTKINKELSIVSPYRADPFGVEFTRINYPGRSTTKNSSDNSVFMLNVNPTPVADSFEATTTTNYLPADASTSLVPFGSTDGDLFSVNGPKTQFTATNTTAYDFRIVVNVMTYLFCTPGESVVLRLKKGSTVIAERTFIAPATEQIFGTDFDVTLPIVAGDVISLEVQTIGSSPSYNCSVNSASMTIGSSAYLIYTLKRPAYTSVTGVDNPETLFNIDLLTPGRIVRKHGNYLRSVLHNMVDSLLEFQTSDKNKDLVTVEGATTIVEKANLRIGSLEAPLFYPYIMSFKTQVPVNFTELLTNAANGHIELTFNGKTLYGFPIEVTAKPALNEAQEWKLLVSPRTNLADLIDLEVDGLNYNIMGDFALTIPHLCPVQFVPLNPEQNAKYHFVHMDDNWFANQVKFYIGEARYFQKWQTNDDARIQVRTNGLGPLRMDLYNCDGQIVRTVEMDQVNTPAIVSPNALFEGTMSFAALPEGTYAIVLTAGSGETQAQFISEIIDLRVSWDMTLLFEYRNNRNKQSVVFSEGYYPSFRVEGWLSDFEPASRFAVYEDQPADIQLLNGISFRRYKLNIGNNQGVPPWVIDKINRIMLLTDTKIDGRAFTRNADAQFEKVDVPGWPMKYWTLDVREAQNRDSSTLSINGELNSNLTVVYNIDTKAFGDGSEDGVVQVTEVD